MIALQTLKPKRLLLQGGLAGILVIVGALSGYLVREYALASYRASSSILLDDVQEFKRAEPALRSRSSVDRFAAARGLQDDPAITEFSRQLATGRSQPVTLEVTYPVTRADIRDIPEPLSREMFKEQKVRPILNVLVSNLDEREATRRQPIMLAYVRDTLLRSVLMERLHATGIDARTLSASLTHKISTARWQAESLSRQIKEMEEIRGKYQEPLFSGGAEQMGSARETIQVPTNETRFLSPGRQLIGLETQRAQVMELLRNAMGRQALTAAVEQYATSMIKRSESEGDTAKLLNAGLLELEQVRSDSTDLDVNYAADEARDNLRVMLVLLRGRYVEVPAEPAEPLVYRAGPGPTASVGGGALLGFLAWLILFRLLNGTATSRGVEAALDEEGSGLPSTRSGGRAG